MLRFLLQLCLWALVSCSCSYSTSEAALVPHNGQAFMLLPSMTTLHARRSSYSAAATEPEDELTFEAQALLPHSQRFEIEGQHAGAGGYFFGPPPPPSLPFSPKGFGPGKMHGYTPFVMLVAPVAVQPQQVEVEQPVITPVVQPVIKETLIQPRIEVRTIVHPVMIDQKSENAPITEKERVVSRTDAVAQPTQQKKSSSSLGARYAAPTITTLQPSSMQVYSASSGIVDDSPAFIRDRPSQLSADRDMAEAVDRPLGRHDVRSKTV